MQHCIRYLEYRLSVIKIFNYEEALLYWGNLVNTAYADKQGAQGNTDLRKEAFLAKQPNSW